MSAAESIIKRTISDQRDKICADFALIRSIAVPKEHRIAAMYHFITKLEAFALVSVSLSRDGFDKFKKLSITIASLINIIDAKVRELESGSVGETSIEEAMLLYQSLCKAE